MAQQSTKQIYYTIVVIALALVMAAGNGFFRSGNSWNGTGDFPIGLKDSKWTILLDKQR
jgi:hypothetical protein